MLGRLTLFTHGRDELKPNGLLSRVSSTAGKAKPAPSIQTYESGTWGPQAAASSSGAHGYRWRRPSFLYGINTDFKSSNTVVPENNDVQLIEGVGEQEKTTRTGARLPGLAKHVEKPGNVEDERLASGICLLITCVIVKIFVCAQACSILCCVAP